MYIAMILCRLYRNKNPTHFIVDWVTIIHEVAEGFTFDWGKLLFDNLVKKIGVHKSQRSKGEPTHFYISTYIMDSICYKTPFHLMNWRWTPKNVEPIHIYHSKLWKENAKDHFYEIFHNVIILIHETLYGNPPPRISKKIMENLGTIEDRYIEEIFSYIRVYGCFTSLHALPKLFPYRMICKEVAYQIVSMDITNELKETKKSVWPTYPI